MGKKKSILLIEREINLINGLRSILEKEGYEIISAYEYYNLKGLPQGQKPDLAIIDIAIPKEMGLNILRKTKEVFPKLPIIAMSVYSKSFSKKELARLGAEEFIAKPFDVGYLKERIAKLIEDKN